MIRPFRNFGFWSMVTLLGYLLVALLLVYPLFNIFRYSFMDVETGALSLSNYLDFFSTPYYRVAFINSLIVSLGGTIGSLLLGVPLAFLTTRYRIRGTSLLSTFAVLALLSPPFIGAYAWITMLGRNGFVRNALEVLGIRLPSIYGALGIILVYSLQYYPFVFLLTASGLKTVDRSLEEAAENLGTRSVRKFFRITLPLVIPSITSGALISFMMSLANFGTPMILGGNFRVLPTMAYNFYVSEVAGRPGMASTVSIVLMLSATLVIFLQRYAASRRKYASVLLNRPLMKELTGGKSVVAHAVCYFIVILSTLPLAVIVVFSFRRTSGPVFAEGFGLDSYIRIFQDVPKTITNSLLFSAAAIVLIVIAGTLLGFVLARRQTNSARALDPLLMIPYIVPGTVLGIGFITAFNQRPLLLSGTGLIIILAYFIRRLPYSVRSSASILKQIDPALEEAGISLGSPPGRTFRKIALPLMVPGIVSGAVMSWITSVNELSASILLYVGRTMTMPIRIYLSVMDGYFGPASAMSTILLLATGTALYILNTVGPGKESAIINR